MDTLWLWLLETTVATALLTLAVASMSYGLRYRPTVLHTLWVLVLLKFITPPILPSYGFVEGLLRAFSGPTPPRDIRIVEGMSLDPAPMTATLFDTLASKGSGFLMAAWIMGAITVCVVQVWRATKFRRVLSSSLAAPQKLRTEVKRMSRIMKIRPIRAVTNQQIQSPFIWCFPGLKLVWPESLSDAAHLKRSRVMLAHELAHVRRGDRWVAMLHMVVGAIWWWNPVYYYVRQRILETAEMACDAIAVQQLPNQRKNYAELFLEHSSFQKSGAPTPVLGVSVGTPSSFERRLSMIVSNRVSGKYSTGGILAIALIAALATPSWSIGGTVDKSKKKGKKAEPQKVVVFLASEDDATGERTIELRFDPENAQFIAEDDQESHLLSPLRNTGVAIALSGKEMKLLPREGHPLQGTELHYEPNAEISGDVEVEYSFSPLDINPVWSTAIISSDESGSVKVVTPEAETEKPMRWIVVADESFETKSDTDEAESVSLWVTSPDARKDHMIVRGMPLSGNKAAIFVEGKPIVAPLPTSDVSTEIRELRKEIKSLRKDLEKIHKRK